MSWKMYIKILKIYTKQREDLWFQPTDKGKKKQVIFTDQTKRSWGKPSNRTEQNKCSKRYKTKWYGKETFSITNLKK